MNIFLTNNQHLANIPRLNLLHQGHSSPCADVDGLVPQNTSALQGAATTNLTIIAETSRALSVICCYWSLFLEFIERKIMTNRYTVPMTRNIRKPDVDSHSIAIADEEIRSGQSFLFREGGVHSMILEIRMKDSIEGTALQHALSQALIRFPHFSRRCFDNTELPTRFYYEPLC